MSSMIFGWHPVSNNTSPLSCSIRIGGHTKVKGSGRSAPIGGIVNWAPDRPHIRRALPLLMAGSSVFPLPSSDAPRLAMLLSPRDHVDTIGHRWIVSEMLDLLAVGANRVFRI